MKRSLTVILLLALICCFTGCDDFILHSDKNSSSSESAVVSSCDHIWDDATCTKPEKCSICGKTRGSALGHSWEDATCTEPEKCSICGKSQGSALGHSYSKGRCTRCSSADPNYVSRDSIFPGKPTLKFYMNSAGGLSFNWEQNYTGGKKINYITVTYTLYDRVGNPIAADITRKSTDRVRLIGPFEAKKNIEFPCDVFVYCDCCDKITFDSLYLEYSDGTTATVNYGWGNTVKRK